MWEYEQAIQLPSSPTFNQAFTMWITDPRCPKTIHRGMSKPAPAWVCTGCGFDDTRWREIAVRTPDDARVQRRISARTKFGRSAGSRGRSDSPAELAYSGTGPQHNDVDNGFSPTRRRPVSAR